jgi:soluble lytic murein transglycosylase
MRRRAAGAGRRRGTEAANRPGYQLAQGEVALRSGQTVAAENLYKTLLLDHPLSSEAEIARAKLTADGRGDQPDDGRVAQPGRCLLQRRPLRGRAEQYRALARQSGLDAGSRNGFAVAAAACDLKLKRLTPAQAEAAGRYSGRKRRAAALSADGTGQESQTISDQKRIVAEMESRFPRSPWLAEALYSSGNMYLLRHEYATAVEYYSYSGHAFSGQQKRRGGALAGGLAELPAGTLRDAARLFDEQIRLYPGATETVSASIGAGGCMRLQDHKPAQAAANYRTVVRAYQHFFYAQMARQRLAALGDAPPVAQPQLDRFQPPPVPPLRRAFPPTARTWPRRACWPMRG